MKMNVCFFRLRTGFVSCHEIGFAFIPIKLHMKVLLKSNKWSWNWDLRNKFDALSKPVLKLYKIHYGTELNKRFLSCVQGHRFKIVPINVMYAYESTKMLYCKRTDSSLNSIILLFHAVRFFRPSNNDKNLALSTPIKTKKTKICHFSLSFVRLVVGQKTWNKTVRFLAWRGTFPSSVKWIEET